MFILYNFDPFIDDQVEASYSHLVAFQHALNVDDAQDIIDEPALEPAVEISIGSHGGTTVDLDKPWLEISINHEIVTIELE
jgi:hypothetical protein